MMSVTMRAKMKINAVTANGSTTTLALQAVAKNCAYPADGSDEDNSFARWTPSANLTMVITNPDFQGKFTLGETFYVDFSPVELSSGSVGNFTSNEALEKEIVSKGLTAPRVSLADLKANIVNTEIVKHVSVTGQVLRWAVLTTANGFAVVGKPSCSASSANDNAEIGEKIAIENSENEL